MLTHGHYVHKTSEVLFCLCADPEPQGGHLGSPATHIANPGAVAANPCPPALILTKP